MLSADLYVKANIEMPLLLRNTSCITSLCVEEPLVIILFLSLHYCNPFCYPKHMLHWVSGHNGHKPKGQNRNGHKPKRPQTETATDRNGHKPEWPQTGTATNRNGHRPKRPQTEKATNQNGHKLNGHKSFPINCLENLSRVDFLSQFYIRFCQMHSCFLVYMNVIIEHCRLFPDWVCWPFDITLI